MIFHWSLSDSKSPLISRTLQTILTDYNNPIILCELFKVYLLQLVLLPFRVRLFILSFLIISLYLSLFPLSFNFTLWSAWTTKSTFLQVIFFFTITWPGHQDEIKWSSQNHWQLFASHSPRRILGCAYYCYFDILLLLLFMLLFIYLTRELTKGSFLGVSLTANLFRFLGFFLVFQPISIL